MLKQLEMFTKESMSGGKSVVTTKVETIILECATCGKRDVDMYFHPEDNFDIVYCADHNTEHMIEFNND